MAASSAKLLCLAVLALLACTAMAQGGKAKGKAPAPSGKAPAPSGLKIATSYRLVSITKWNTTADVKALQAAEEEVVKACKQWFTAGVTGYSTEAREDTLWGSHIKVFDFPSSDNYKNYSTCVSAQPGRSTSQPWESWKNRAFYSWSGDSATAFAGSYWFVSIVNSTNDATLVSKYQQFDAELDSLLATKQAAVTIDGVVSGQLKVSHVHSYKKPQGWTAVIGYVNSAGTWSIPALPLAEETSKLHASSPRNIAFAPIVV